LLECGERSKRARRRGTGADQRNVEKAFWSALQTHLQGVDRATLAVMPEMIRNHAQPSLLARMSFSK
jgi:hypothetical protein